MIPELECERGVDRYVDHLDNPFMKELFKGDLVSL